MDHYLEPVIHRCEQQQCEGSSLDDYLIHEEEKEASLEQEQEQEQEQQEDE